MALFLDGTMEVSQTTGGPTMTGNIAPLRAGQSACSGDLPFTGAMDELSIFNRALSSNEIAAIYAAGSAGMCKPQVPPSIVGQPTNVVVFQTQVAAFHVSAIGDVPLRYQWRFNGNDLAGGTNDVLSFSSAQPSLAGAYDVVVSNPLGAVTSVVATLTVRTDIPDLAVVKLAAPPVALAGQAVPFIFTITNQGSGTALLPWANAVFLGTDTNGGGARTLGSFPQGTALVSGASVTVTQSVILPSDLAGAWFPGITADSAGSVFETNKANNTLIAMTPVIITAPDLEVSALSTSSSGIFGQTLSVTWVVRNRGTGSTFANWSDALYLSAGSNSTVGATLLRTVSAARPLAPGESYTNSAVLTLPLNRTLVPGGYFLLVQADSANSQPEADEDNNLTSRAISITLPPLPDLMAANVSSASNAFPGQAIAVEWVVTNQGPANASGPWKETIRLVADEVTRLTNSAEVQSLLTSAATLATLTFSNTLPPGAYLTRTQVVTLPVNGPSGDVRLVVTVDAQDDVFEENETNNVTFAQGTLNVPVSLTLQLSSAQISEAATVPLQTTLTRNGSTAQPLTVTVMNSNPGELSFVQSLLTSAATNITIPAGQSAVVFDLYAVRDNVVDGNQLVTISASALGYESASASVTVLNADLPTLTLSPATNTVTEGFGLSLSVTRDVVTGNALTVALSSSSPGQLSPPGFVTIPAGAASTNFTVLAVDDVNAEAPATYSISASASGFNSGVANITVLDNDVPQLTVSLSSHSVSEGAGPQALSMTVTRIPVGAGALNIEPFTGEPSLLVTPLRITIPAGQASRSFPVGVIDDSLVNGSRPAVLGAYALATGSGARLCEATPGVLTVTDDDGPTLKLTVAKKLVREGLNPATTGTVPRNTPATNFLLVSLSSSRTNEATVPASVTLSNGAVSATFPVISVADGTNDGNQTVVLTASAAGFTDGVETLVVSDTDLPDLVVSSLSAPAAAVPQQRVNVTYRVSNQGLSATAGSFLTRIYLSRDSVIGDDVLVAQFRTTNSLAVGSYFEDNEQIQLPLDVGNYWVVVETDAEQTLAEVLEDNNVRISSAPIAVAADYAAWVQTDITNAPAGTPVPLYGRATNSLGAGVVSRPVNIHVLVRGTRRILTATTDGNGDFATTFAPLPNEAGHYDVFATHPGVSAAPVQDAFTLLGFRANPASISLTVVECNSASPPLKVSRRTSILA